MGETGPRACRAKSGAEGATAPETLRQKDRRGEGTLESRRAGSGAPHRRGNPSGLSPPANLSGSGTEGLPPRRAPRRICEASVSRPERPMTETPLQSTPLHALHRRARRAGWCRSPATTCRCNTRPASSPSICTPAPPAGLFDVSHMGQAAPRRGRRRRSAGAAGARRHPGLKPGRMRYTLLHQRRRRHPRRPHGHQPRRPPVPGRQRRLQGRTTSRI